MTVDPQLSLIPLDSPALIALHTGQLVARITRLAPQLYPCQCNVLIAELALVAIRLDHIEDAVTRRWQPKPRRVVYPH